MTSSRVLSISRAYADRSARNNLLVRHQLSLSSSSSSSSVVSLYPTTQSAQRRRCYETTTSSLSVAQHQQHHQLRCNTTTVRSRRRVPLLFPSSGHYFSSTSPVSDNNDDDDNDDNADQAKSYDDDGSSFLRVAIDRLKNSNSSSRSNPSAPEDGGHDAGEKTMDRSTALSEEEEEPSSSSSSSYGSSSSSGGGLGGTFSFANAINQLKDMNNNAGTGGTGTTTTTDTTATKKEEEEVSSKGGASSSSSSSRLSDLMKTDLFAKSWSEPDISNARGGGGGGSSSAGFSNNNRRGRGDNSGGGYGGGRGGSDSSHGRRGGGDYSGSSAGDGGDSSYEGRGGRGGGGSNDDYYSRSGYGGSRDGEGSIVPSDGGRGGGDYSRTSDGRRTTRDDNMFDLSSDGHSRGKVLQNSPPTSGSRLRDTPPSTWEDDEDDASSDSMTPVLPSGSRFLEKPPSSWEDDTTSSDTNIMTSSWEEDDTYSDTIYSQPQKQQPPSPAQIEYNSLLEQTNELLEMLSEDNDNYSATLVLMDFDRVMTKLSQFHSEVDGIKKKHGSDNVTSSSSFASSSSYYGGDDNESLKQKASDQCTKLLHALERNYDCLLHHALPASSIMAKEGEGEDSSNLPRTKYSKLEPNAVSYNLALHALANSEKGETAAQEAYTILMRMLDRCERHLEILDRDVNEGEEDVELAKLPRPPFEPTIITVNSVLHAIAKSGARDAGFLAEEVYVKMEEWRSQCKERQSRLLELGELGSNAAASVGESASYHGVLPNARTLACVIDAWANAKTEGHQSFSPERAEAILDLAVRRRRAYVNSVTGGHDDVDSQDYDHESSDDEQKLSEFLMDDDDIEEEMVDDELQMTEHVPASLRMQDAQIEELYPQSETAGIEIPALKPNTVAFNTCINAWAQAAASGRGHEGVLRAQELLMKLEALSQSEALDLPNGHSDGFLDEEDSLADSSLRPNVRTYSMVMNAWANVANFESRSGEEAASHCQNILNRMEERGAEESSVRPNLVAYVTAISAWARASNHVEHAASRAEDILNRMIDLYYGEEDDTATAELPIIGGDVENASHDAPFNAVITAYARSSDPYAAERALAVLQRLEASPITATTTTYNAVMDVCAKHKDSERALEIFKKMEDMSITRDSTSYDTVLNAFAMDTKLGSAERAHDFLCQLEEDSNFIPSSVSYTIVINAFARTSGTEHGGIAVVKKAKDVYGKLIGQMKDGAIYEDPDPFANSCFLNCCANMYGTRSEKKEALIMAITTFEDMKKHPNLHGHPNQYTFGTMVKACARLSSNANEKDRLMESLFTQATKRGCVSNAVLGQFLRHTPSHLNMKVILSLGGTKRDIPEDWYHTVPRNHRPMPMNY